jgi:hypothetical protein
MTFLDLVKIEVDYRRYAHDVSALRLVCLRHDAANCPGLHEHTTNTSSK